MNTIEPVRTREPFFDGLETGMVHQSYSCPSCGSDVKIGFTDIHHAAWNWRDETEHRLRASLAAHFGIDLTNMYIGDGMDAVVAAQCPRCARTMYVYFWFHEYRHSCYQISLRGVVINET